MGTLPWAFLLAIAALGFFSMAWNSLLMSEAARVAPPKDVGLVTARLMIYYSGGSLLGPLVFTVLFALTDSYGLTYMFFAVPAVIGAVCVSGAMREGDRGPRGQGPALPCPD